MESKHTEINQKGEADNLPVQTLEPAANQPPTLQPEPMAQSNQRRIKIAEVKTRSPFNDLFPVAENVLKAIQNDIDQNGYDLSQAIIVWKKEMVVVDGHTRLLAAQNLGHQDISVCFKDFENEDAAFDYAVHNQRDRRNLSDADILRLVGHYDERKKRGGNHGNQYTVGKTDGNATSVALGKPRSGSRSSKDIAEKIGTNRGKVEKAFAIIDAGDEGPKKAVSGRSVTINKAHKELREKENLNKKSPKGEAIFSEEKNSWARFSWNPMVGCKAGCPHCPGREKAEKHFGGFKPKFRPEFLKAPQNTPLPKTNDPGDRNVHVCPVTDLFGDGVSQDRINQVLKAVEQSPDWNFFFLTKNPDRLIEIEWPENAWVGVMVDTQDGGTRAEEAFTKVKCKRKFLYCELGSEPIAFKTLEPFKWLILESGKEQPQWEWVESLLNQARQAGLPVFFGSGLKIQPKEFPK
jgi:protein gp37